MVAGECEFRFYEELNDFLAPARRRHAFAYRFHGTPAVKDAIEALSVPHTEVDLILVDGESVRFSHRLRGGECVAAYPVFERLDITPVARLRPVPLRTLRFVADVHLGTLARYLRLLGFDTRYDNHSGDAELVRRSVAEQGADSRALRACDRPKAPARGDCARAGSGAPDSSVYALHAL